MSTQRRAERGLFARLIDDAAVFPPGQAPLERAVGDYRRRRSAPYADLVGPLLVPASAAGRLREILVGTAGDAGAQAPASRSTAPLPVGLVARPGSPLRLVSAALEALTDTEGVQVVGVEIAHQPGWTAALAWDLPLAVEVDRDHVPQRSALAALQDARDESVQLRAKLRTQSTDTDPVPTAQEVAGFIEACAGLGLPFKLTGGLHHAVTGTRQSAADGPEDQHGVLNILLATHLAGHGAGRPDLVDVLLSRDGQAPAGALADLTPEEVGAVRGLFTAYGCCGVEEPIQELVALGLLTDQRHDPVTEQERTG